MFVPWSFCLWHPRATVVNHPDTPLLFSRPKNEERRTMKNAGLVKIYHAVKYVNDVIASKVIAKLFF